MIGDDSYNDIYGAVKAGMDTVYFNPAGEKHELHPTYEIRTLAELKDIFWLIDGECRINPVGILFLPCVFCREKVWNIAVLDITYIGVGYIIFFIVDSQIYTVLQDVQYLYFRRSLSFFFHNRIKGKSSIWKSGKPDWFRTAAFRIWFLFAFLVGGIFLIQPFHYFFCNI